MPLHRGHDDKGSYYQYGSKGKHAYYTPGNAKSREAAKKRAESDKGRIEYFKHKGSK